MEDEISNGRFTAVCSEPGALRRCGGQGDILAGCIAAQAAWMPPPGSNGKADGVPDTVAAAYGAAVVVRTAARWAFEARKRSMVAGDMLEFVGPAVDSVLDKESAPLKGKLGFM